MQQLFLANWLRKHGKQKKPDPTSHEFPAHDMHFLSLPPAAPGGVRILLFLRQLHLGVLPDLPGVQAAGGGLRGKFREKRKRGGKDEGNCGVRRRGRGEIRSLLLRATTTLVFPLSFLSAFFPFLFLENEAAAAHSPGFFWDVGRRRKRG